jgi:ubiquinone/menaquinone biosynthesis C-methylase UbiE
MSEDRRAGLVYSGSSGELVTADDALGAPCWEPAQQERRWAATALETLRSSLGTRQPSRIVDLGCGSGELTTRIASLWPAADIVAVDQSDLMTLFTQGSALAAGHRNVRAITADAAGDLGIEPGSTDLVVASCIANNMLNEIAGHCPDVDADTVG